MDLLSRLDLFQIGRRYVIARATKIDPAIIDTEGSDANLFVGSQSFVAHAVVRQLAERTTALLLDGADGEDLDRLAWDRYQERRKGAAAAVGEVRMFRSVVTPGAGDVPIGTKLVTLQGIEYVTTTVATFAASATQVTGVKVRAVQAGKQFQVGANSIRRFASPPAFDPAIQVTNDVATAGGENIETDEEFKDRLRSFWGTARRGILAAIEFGARAVPGVASAQASEALTPGALPARVVNLYIADSSGVANNALAQIVRNSLGEFRAAGIAVVITTSIPQLVQIELRLQFMAGVDTSTVGESVRASVFEFVNSLPVNGTLFRGELFSVLKRFKTQGLIVSNESIVEPVGDVVPALGRSLRTTLSRVILL